MGTVVEKEWVDKTGLEVSPCIDIGYSDPKTEWSPIRYDSGRGPFLAPKLKYGVNV